MTVFHAFGDIAETLAAIDPAKTSQLKAPKEMSNRVELLVSKKKKGLISMNEMLELERFLALDLLINMTKAHALVMLKG